MLYAVHDISVEEALRHYFGYITLNRQLVILVPRLAGAKMPACSVHICN
jgi:hypothetical protein